jgi:PBP1b-binding outer membrane lipoprotein LpoB
MGMKKIVLLFSIVGAAILMAGCSYIDGDEAQGQDPKKKQPSLKQEKTVVVDKGMSKKEEKELKNA